MSEAKDLFHSTSRVQISFKIQVLGTQLAKILHHLGSFCGSFGRAVASDTRGPRFESSHRNFFIYTVNWIETTKINNREAGNVPINFLKWTNSGLFYRLFSVFSNKHQYKFYNKLMWKTVHPVYGAGIRTYNLRNMSLLP